MNNCNKLYFISNLPYDSTEKELKTFFLPYNELIYCKLIKTVYGIKSCYGYISFKNDNNNIINYIENNKFKKKKIFIDFLDEKEDNIEENIENNYIENINVKNENINDEINYSKNIEIINENGDITNYGSLILKNMNMHDVVLLIKKIQELIRLNPSTAIKLLNENKTICYSLIHSLFLLGILNIDVTFLNNNELNKANYYKIKNRLQYLLLEDNENEKINDKLNQNELINEEKGGKRNLENKNENMYLKKKKKINENYNTNYSFNNYEKKKSYLYNKNRKAKNGNTLNLKINKNEKSNLKNNRIVKNIYTNNYKNFYTFNSGNKIYKKDKYKQVYKINDSFNNENDTNNLNSNNNYYNNDLINIDNTIIRQNINDNEIKKNDENNYKIKFNEKNVYNETNKNNNINMDTSDMNVNNEFIDNVIKMDVKKTNIHKNKNYKNNKTNNVYNYSIYNKEMNNFNTVHKKNINMSIDKINEKNNKYVYNFKNKDNQQNKFKNKHKNTNYKDNFDKNYKNEESTTENIYQVNRLNDQNNFNQMNYRNNKIEKYKNNFNVFDDNLKNVYDETKINENKIKKDVNLEYGQNIMRKIKTSVNTRRSIKLLDRKNVDDSNEQNVNKIKITNIETNKSNVENEKMSNNLINILKKLKLSSLSEIPYADEKLLNEIINEKQIFQNIMKCKYSDMIKWSNEQIIIVLSIRKSLKRKGFLISDII